MRHARGYSSNKSKISSLRLLSLLRTIVIAGPLFASRKEKEASEEILSATSTCIVLYNYISYNYHKSCIIMIILDRYYYYY